MEILQLFSAFLILPFVISSLFSRIIENFQSSSRFTEGLKNFFSPSLYWKSTKSEKFRIQSFSHRFLLSKPILRFNWRSKRR